MMNYFILNMQGPNQLQYKFNKIMSSLDKKESQKQKERYPIFNYKQFVSSVDYDSFQDDSLFYDKNKIINLINQTKKKKKITSIYDKIIHSNKNDPLYPASLKKNHQSLHHRFFQQKQHQTLLPDKFCQTTRKFQFQNEEFKKNKQQTPKNSFFKGLLKKFSENLQQEDSITYQKKIHLFKKIFQHYKIKPQQKDHFQQLLKKISQKQTPQVHKKFTSKMKLQQRQNNLSQGKKRLSWKTRFSDMLSIQSHVLRKQKNDCLNSSQNPQKCKEPQNLTQNNQNFHDNQEAIKDQIQQKMIQSDKYQIDEKLMTIINLQRKPKTTFHSSKSKTQKKFGYIKQNQTPIDIKLGKYRQFLFTINFTNNLFVNIEVEKYSNSFKFYIGKGNNSNLIKSIMKKRFWFQSISNINEANFVWTQIKDQTVFKKQSIKQSPLINNKNQFNTIESFDIQKQQNQKDQTLDRSLQFDLLIKNGAQTQKKLSSRNTRNKRQYLTLDNKFMCKPSTSQQIESRQTKKQRKIQLNFAKKHAEETPIQKILTIDQLKAYQNKFQSLKIKLKRANKSYSFQQRKKYFVTIMNEQNKKNLTIHNHLPVNGLLGNKKAMFYILKQYYKLTHKNIFNIVPLTFHIKNGLQDEQFKNFLTVFQHRKKKKQSNYWVIKPGEFSNRGNGITCTNKMEQVRKRIINCKKQGKNKSIILQSYITNPLLYNGRKFDIRAYMLLTIVNGKIRGYWYQEGYVRTSSYFWNINEIQDREIHLTNDAVQKYTQGYGKYEPGNKLSYRDLQRYLQNLTIAGKHSFDQKILPSMKQIAADSIKSSFLFLDPNRLQNNFEIFGFDFMIDTNLKPWLIQINTNPCLQLSCPLLQRLIPNMVQNAFRISLDPLFPPPSNVSSSYKYNIAENALYYNRFELIFDEERDGVQIQRLYENSEIISKIEDVEEDKQTFQEQGEEIQLTNNGE